MSLDASGTIAGSVVFSKWKGRNYVRRHAIPSNPKSGLQVGIRSVFKFLTQDWTNLADARKAEWADEAAPLDITSLNAQIRSEIDRARRNLGWRNSPDPAAVTTPEAPTDAAAAAAPNSLNLTWTRPAGNQGDYTVAIYRSTSTGFTPGISNLIAVLDVSSEAHTDKGLTTGVEYFYDIRETNTDGDLGALHGEFSGTPT